MTEQDETFPLFLSANPWHHRFFLFRRQSLLFEWQREGVWVGQCSSNRSVIRREPGAAHYGGGQRGEEADDDDGGGWEEGGREGGDEPTPV